MQSTYKIFTHLFLLGILCTFTGQAHAAPRYNQTLCQQPGYTCLTIHKGNTWETLFPDERQRNIVMRLNRMSVEPHQGMAIAVPVQLHTADYLALAPFKQQMNTDGMKTIIADPKEHAWAAYDEAGRLINWGPASFGKPYCPDTGQACHTPAGTFAIYHVRGETCKSSQFPIGKGGAPMPFCMFFKNGIALHGSYDLPGYHASHGCVRLPVEDAKWLHQQFIQIGTKVIIEPYAT